MPISVHTNVDLFHFAGKYSHASRRIPAPQAAMEPGAPKRALLQRPIVVLHNPRIQGIAPDALAPVTWNIDDWRR